MAAVKRRTPAAKRPASAAASTLRRYTIDASVFVNAFNPPERGHRASLALLTAIHAAADPVILPSLALVEIASAMARASDDAPGGVAFAAAVASLPHVTVVPLTVAGGQQAGELAASHRLRGADAVYASIARRYGTILVTRDERQRARATSVIPCVTPEEALSGRS